MVAQAVFFLYLFAEMVTVATEVTISAAAEEVRVRKGEPLQLSCDIRYDLYADIAGVKWFKHQETYGEIYFCASGDTAQLNYSEINTTDARGVIRYERGRTNSATLMLIIPNSEFEDSGQFVCMVSIRKVDTSLYQRSSAVDVSVTACATTDVSTIIRRIFSGRSSFPATSRPTKGVEEATVAMSIRVEVQTLSTAPSHQTTSDTRAHVSTAYQRSSQYGKALLATTSRNPPDLTTSSPSTTVGQSIFSSTSTSAALSTKRFTRSQTEGTSSPKAPSALMSTDPTPLPGRPILIAVSAAAGGVIFILLAVVACLVSSRKTASGGVTGNTNVSISLAAVSGRSETGSYATSFCNHRDYQQPGSRRAGGNNAVALGYNKLTGSPPTSPTAAYAVVPIPGLQLPSPPTEYAVLDPDFSSHSSDDDHVYESTLAQQMKRQDRREDETWVNGVNFKQSVVERPGVRDRETPDSQAEVRQPAPVVSSAVPCGHDSGCSGDCDRKFVDNILYEASSDSAIINEQRFGASVMVSQKKIKGNPRLDPF
ncbi:mucin-5AC-like [Acanthaster planci]|uniref:Mucin-5AC-like n=1 Tax=Acanthaster planci TaxID=133434 RepID=A0A8B7ZP50_ACAPL|nr:mucin-5AC-like [Acanthaster planci]